MLLKSMIAVIEWMIYNVQKWKVVKVVMCNTASSLYLWNGGHIIGELDSIIDFYLICEPLSEVMQYRGNSLWKPERAPS